MTLTALGGYFESCPIYSSNGNTSVTAAILDAASEYLGYTFVFPVTDSIVSVEFRTGLVTTGGDVDVRIETVNTTTGAPTGTLWGTNTNVIVSVASTDDNVWKTATLTAAASGTAGQLAAVVIRWSATFNGNINYKVNNGCREFPYGFTAIPTFSQTAGQGIGCLNFSTNGYYPMSELIGMLSGAPTFNSGSTPDVYANKITMPFTAKCCGFWITADFDSAVNINLYDTDGVTVLATIQNPVGIPPVTTSTNNRWAFNTHPTLNSGSSYWLGVEPTTATNFTMRTLTYPSAAARAQHLWGAYLQKSTAKNPTGVGSWTDTSTELMQVFPIFSEIDFGGGGGGLAANIVRGFTA